MSNIERKVQHDIFLYGITTLQLESIGGVEFTQREVDVIACILSGKSAKKIALLLSISPKTVENHIRNITLKLGCRTQSDIIDFVERSNKFMSVKRHYSNLLLHSFFEQELVKIAELANEHNVHCMVAYTADCKEYTAFVTRFSNHLKLCGINIIVRNNKQELPVTQKIDFILYINACAALGTKTISNSDETMHINSIVNLGKERGVPVLSVVLNKDTVPASRHSLLFNDDIILIEQNNYYLLVLETIQKLLKQDIEANTNSFIQQMEELSGIPHNVLVNKTSTQLSANLQEKKQNKISIKKALFSLGMLVVIMFAVFSMQISNIDKHRYTFMNVAFNWILGGDSCQKEIASKYLEGLEEEEAKLGKLDKNLDIVRFMQTKHNFIKLSNMLLSIPENEISRSQKLLNLVHEKFPLNNRTNEKVHKLFYALASYYGKLDFIKVLTEKAKISFGDFKDFYGNTAPMLAAAGNNVSTFTWLVQNDALFFNHTNVEGNSSLILAALGLPSDNHLSARERDDSIEILKRVYENDSNSINSRGHKGCTPLLVAGASGNIAAVEYLLNIQAPDNPSKQLQILQEERNADGNNIMMIAAFNGHEHLVEWLYHKGISIYQYNKYNTSAFMQAASGGSMRSLDMLYSLHEKDAKENKIDLLLEANNFGQTALFLAAHKNHINGFEWFKTKLLKNNFADDNSLSTEYIRNVRNSDGDTLLHVLISGMSDINKLMDTSLNTGLLDVLLDYLDVNVHALLDEDKVGDTPLMRAAYYGNLPIVKYLIEKCGADPNQTNFRGEGPLYSAAMSGNGQYFSVIGYLLDLKAKNEGRNIYEVRKQHSSEIFLTAAQHGQKEVVEWLLRENPELIEARNSHGDNALSLAVKNSHIDIIEFIFSWDKKTAVRQSIEKRTNTTMSIVEQLIHEEQEGSNKHISLNKYIEQKVGISMWQNSTMGTKHNDTNYKWRTLEIGINGLSTSAIQPWSPYYLHYEARFKAKDFKGV